MLYQNGYEYAEQEKRLLKIENEWLEAKKKPPAIDRITYVLDGQETIGPIRRFIDKAWIPFLNAFPPKIGQWLFKKSSKDGAQVSKDAKTFKALEKFYNDDGNLHLEKGWIDGIFTYIWQRIHNVQAVRNRKKILDRIAKEVGPIGTWISFGSGSARSSLEYKRINPFTKVKLFDPWEPAFEYSQNLAEKLEVKDSLVTWYPELAQKFTKCIKREKGKYLFEMVGLLDYFSDKAGRVFFRILDRWMMPGDVFVVSNIIDNKERPFAERIIKWDKMIYRDTQDLYDLLLAGYLTEDKYDIELFVEATGIYSIAVVIKK